MKAQVESISPVKTRISVEVPADEVERETGAAYRDLQRSVSLPGFRKGKAPLSALRRQFGDRVRSDVIGRLVERTYREALLAERIVPVTDADIQLQSDPEDAHLSYTAIVEVRPKVEPRGYGGLSWKKARIEVDEVAAEARLEALREQRASYEPAPEGHRAAAGDMAVVDYVGKVDGEPFEGGTGQDRPVALGSGMFVPGFEEGLVGAASGEQRQLEVTFPEDYRATELAGKQARFEVTVKDLKVRHLPALDDEFAKELAGLDSLAELRQRVREELEAEQRDEAEREFRGRVIATLLDANPFEVPESLVRNQQAHSLERIRADLAQRGHDPEALGIDKPEVQEAHRRGAERSVRWAFLLRAIAEKEGIEIGDADVEARLQEIAAADGRPLATIRAFFEQEDRLDTLRSAMLERRVVERVVELGSVEEVAAADLEGGEDRDE